MTLAHLVACPACARHVRATDAACPFCRAELPESLRSSMPRRPPGVRLGRAALYAFGVGSLTVATECSSAGGSVFDAGSLYDSTSHPLYGDASRLPVDGSTQPLYGGGAPIRYDATAEKPHDAVSPQGVDSQPLYGDASSLPFHGDAATDAHDAAAQPHDGGAAGDSEK